jgi:hypothetical protein
MAMSSETLIKLDFQQKSPLRLFPSALFFAILLTGGNL